MRVSRSRRRAGAHGRRGAPLLVALVLSGCVTNHDLLAEQDRPGGTGGAFGAGGTSHSGGVGGSGDGSVEAEASPPPAEPPGDRKLTVLHGVIDAPWVTFCFARVRGGIEGAVSKAPVPAGGLLYGHSAALDAPGGADLSVDGFRAYVVAAASADVVAGMDCPAMLARAAELAVPPESGDAGAEGTSRDATATLRDAAPRSDVAVPSRDASLPVDASRAVHDGAVSSPEGGAGADARAAPDAAVPRPDAGAPPIAAIRVRPLPLIPEGALAEASSYLLAAGGCLGGRGVTDPSERSVCGEQYSASSPTLAEMLVRRSRFVTSGKVGIQVLDATPAVRQLDLRITPGLHSDAIPIARSVVTGAIRPVPPNRTSSAGEIAATTDGASIQLFADGGSTPIYDEPWTRTLAAGDLPALEDGKSYTLVVVGPYPGFAKRRWWNDPMVTIVEN